MKVLLFWQCFQMIHKTNCTSTEIAVVGSGPGGAITAAHLAEAGKNVLLIEEGNHFKENDCSPFSIQEMILKYRNRGITPALGKPPIAYIEGCCVGGGSEVNSGLYHRTPDYILDKWARDFQLTGIAQKDLKNHFEICEKEVFVSYLPSDPPKTSLKLKEGGEKLGWQTIETPRWVKYSNDPKYTDYQKNRQPMSKTYIPKFLKNDGKLLSGTRVNKLSKDGRNWTLHCFNKFKSNYKISAQTIFLSAGSIQTPALLQRSGIRKNIGNTLSMQPMLKVVAK